MGGSNSTPSSALHGPPVTKSPWRTIPAWNEDFESSLRQDIKEIRPGFHPNVVLIGPIGAGKSSFVNSILSIAKGYKVDRATAENNTKSCTISYGKYTEENLLQDFSLRDCMGIEQLDGDGINIADMVAILKGHIKDGYPFNASSPISTGNSFYRDNPGSEQQAKCVVFVVSAKDIHTTVADPIVKKIREVQKEVKRLRIPRVLILTKADVLCEEVHKDIQNIFGSVKIREAVKAASELFKIPEASIHPVKNYEDADAIEITWKRNIPLLIALRQITQYANDTIEANNKHNDSD